MIKESLKKIYNLLKSIDINEFYFDGPNILKRRFPESKYPYKKEITIFNHNGSYQLTLLNNDEYEAFEFSVWTFSLIKFKIFLLLESIFYKKLKIRKQQNNESTNKFIEKFINKNPD